MSRTAPSTRLTLEPLEDRLVPDAAKLIQGLYADVLRRTPSTAEVNGWLQYLQAGFSAMDLAAQFWFSPEHRGLQVDGYYRTYLRRAADAEGRRHFVDSFLNGSSEVQVQETFLTSPEYVRAQAGNDGYVRALYRDVLGRTATQAEVASWVATVVNGQNDLGDVALGFLASDEERLRVIDGYYRTYLNRAADTAGRQYWLNTLNDDDPKDKKVDRYPNGDWLTGSGSSLEEVAVLLTSSAEYQLRQDGRTFPQPR